MNDVIKQLYDRKSVRAYEDREISEEITEEILKAAVMAPTAGNQQLYTIIKVTDQDIKERLVESCDHQSFIAKSKLLLVFCADCLKWYKAFIDAGCDPRKPGEGDLLLAVDDALIATQNAVVAAQSYGIGSCYIGDIMENIETQREILGLPEYVFPAALVVFGYPSRQQEDRPKPPRADMKYIVHENRYRNLEPEELKAMIVKDRDPETHEEWMKAFCERKFNSGFAREMTRSVRKYLERFSDR